MPKLVSKVEGRGNGIKTAVMNCKEVATAIHRPPGYIMKWFGCELGAKSDYNEKEGEGQRAILMGSHQTATLQESLDKFLGTYVLCPTCGLPEMDLKLQKKGDNICGTCKACGWAGLLNDGTAHKMAAYVLKNPINAGDATENEAKKLSKEERQARRAAKARGDEEDDSKKKKKKKDSDDEDDKKKKKKEKKEKKKSKRSREDGSDAEGGGDGNSSSGEEGTRHKDEDVLNLIQNLRPAVSGKSEDFLEEVKLGVISAVGIENKNKMIMYVALETIYGDSELTAASIEKHSELILALIKGANVNVADMMWGFELFIFEHQDFLKGFPHVCKALYDLDLIDDDNFLPYYKDKKANKANPGHKMVHKVVEPFANWLEADSSDDSD